MTASIGELRATTVAALQSSAGADAASASFAFNCLAKHALGMDDHALLLSEASATPDSEGMKTLAKLAGELAAGQPLAHLLGSQSFRDLEIECSPAALIPRPETEILVETVLVHARRPKAELVADLGTGSGAIAAALATELPHARILAYEAENAACEVAQGNFTRLGLDNVELVHADWSALDTKVDIVVSNPPYVTSALCRRALAARTLHDPAEALDGGPDGLDAIRSVVSTASRQLRGGGLLALEHGVGQHHATAAIAAQAGLAALPGVRDLQNLMRIHLSRQAS